MELNCMWSGPSEFILIKCRAQSPDLTNYKVMNLLAGHFCSETVSQMGYILSRCGILPDKCPSALFMRDIWVSEQQANHVGQVGGVKSGYPLESVTWHSLLSPMNNILLHTGLVELNQLLYINVNAAVKGANSFPWMPNEDWITHVWHSCLW